MKQLNSTELEAILNENKPVVIDFFETWCGPCKMLAPVFEEVSGYYDDVNFVKVNVDECPDLAMKYRISVIPTLIVIKDGNQTAQTKGYLNADELRAFVDGGI